MAVYGGALWNSITPGRINLQLVAAQAGTVRRTALKVQVLDSQLNGWTEHAGTAIQIGDLNTPSSDKAATTSPSYRYYRLQMGMCILTNGNIIRVRVGNGTYADRQIYVQTITDPTVAAQWTSWSLLYSGTHYAVGVAPATASTYHVYAAKSAGIYKNNVLKQSITNVIEINPVKGQTDAMFVTKLNVDSVDDKRVMDHYYSPNIETTAFADDKVNYRWIRSEISALLLDNGKIARAQVAGFYIDPRSTNLAESLTISIAPAYTNIEPETPPYIVRGFVGQAGSNSIINPHLTKMNDGFYYLFYTESRYDYDKTYSVSISQTVFWQRSVDLIHWSEPVAIGYPNMNPTGIAVVESGNYAYLANNGSVYARPTAVTTYTISDYVPEVELEIPRQNQGGSGVIKVANPNGINDFLHNRTDCEVLVQAGIYCSDGVYRYVDFNRWWIDRVKSEVDGQVNRLSVTLYDMWKRLDNPLRDNYNNVGCVVWNDWATARKNALYNYYYRGGTVKAISEKTSKYVQVKNPTSKNAFMYTGVKSHNGDISVRFRGSPSSSRKIGILYRYTNENNYYWCYSDGADIRLVRVRNGASTVLYTDTTNVSGWFTLRVVYRWGIHRVYLNGILQFTYNETLSGTAPGYAGVRGTSGDFTFDNFKFTDWLPKITTNDLITSLLAMGDFHSPSVAGGEQSQLAIVWGPQTELNTPAKALASLAEQYKLELAWRDARVTVGQFKDPTVVLEYENQVLDVKRTEEVGRRINLASVDGREDSWIEIDGPDTRIRGRQIVAYFDVPDLVADDDVRLRAQEEIRKGVVGSTYEGNLPLQFDLWRMDGIRVTNNVGEVLDLKVEGIKISINQSTAPRQNMTLDMSPLT